MQNMHAISNYDSREVTLNCRHLLYAYSKVRETTAKLLFVLSIDTTAVVFGTKGN
jgi:hypothetical protein